MTTGKKLWPLVEKFVFLESDFFLLSLRKRQIRQIHTFELLAPRFFEVLNRLERAADKYARLLIMPVWQNYNAKIRRELQPKPRIDFLRIETITKTIAPIALRGSLICWYKKLLQNHIPMRNLSRLLEENYVGKPLISWPRYRSSFASVQHLFHIAYLGKHTNTIFDDVKTILEWGGGYGNFAKIMQRFLDRQITYIMIDTPLMTAIQWFYLSSILGQESVHLLDDSAKKTKKGVINLVTLPFINNINERPNLFVSTWALSESSESALDLVNSKGWLKSEHVLMAMYKDDLIWTTGNRILSDFRSWDLNIIEMSHYPRNFYVIR